MSLWIPYKKPLLRYNSSQVFASILFHQRVKHESQYSKTYCEPIVAKWIARLTFSIGSEHLLSVTIPSSIFSYILTHLFVFPLFLQKILRRLSSPLPSWRAGVHNICTVMIKAQWISKVTFKINLFHGLLFHRIQVSKLEK